MEMKAKKNKYLLDISFIFRLIAFFILKFLTSEVFDVTIKLIPMENIIPEMV